MHTVSFLPQRVACIRVNYISTVRILKLGVRGIVCRSCGVSGQLACRRRSADRRLHIQRFRVRRVLKCRSARPACLWAAVGKAVSLSIPCPNIQGCPTCPGYFFAWGFTIELNVDCVIYPVFIHIIFSTIFLPPRSISGQKNSQDRGGSQASPGTRFSGESII